MYVLWPGYPFNATNRPTQADDIGKTNSFAFAGRLIAALNTQLDRTPEAELLYKRSQALIQKYNQEQSKD